MTIERFDRVHRIAREHGVSESEAFERALERDLEELWNDLVFAQCLGGELDRDEAVERVDRATPERTELEIAEVEWGLNE